MQRWSRHSAYSDPGRHRALLRDLPADLTTLCAAARNVIGHYRAELTDLPPGRRDEVDSRWLATILATDQARHPHPLDHPRPAHERVAGCCRDHSLFVVAALREHGIPARTRVGFASYLVPGHHIDHVVIEFWNGSRWQRADPEFPPGSLDVDPEDLPDGPFHTAARAWTAHRNSEVSADGYCIHPGSELSGPDLIRAYVVLDVAHRHGDELLLWDGWGAAEFVDDAMADGVAALVLDADAGDQTAEGTLTARYDNHLRPPPVVTQYSPFGEPPIPVRLRQAST